MLRFIESFTLSNGYPPSMREIATALTIRSSNAVKDHLNALERKGYIERQPTTSRGMRITRHTKEFLEEEAIALRARLAEVEAQLSTMQQTSIDDTEQS
jgi:repressor LexA